MDIKNKSRERKLVVLLLASIILEGLLFLFFINPFLSYAIASVGQNNVTVQTLLTVGNSFPEILNITINNGNSVDLTPNGTVSISVYIVARDYNGEADISSIRSEFFDNASSNYGGADDNNYHYTNNTCNIDTAYGDSTEVNATCIFRLQYYANNATWNNTVFINDTTSASSLSSKNAVINTLLALGLPNSIDYGLVNATAVSSQSLANVTNFGNALFNLTLSGYAHYAGDNNSMNCSLGAAQNISINYEKYNLTASNTSTLTLQQFENPYTNLSSSSTTKTFNLNYRQNDTNPYIDDTNATYWRIYVPVGVAGSCTGNIVFGAVKGAGT